MFSVFSGQRPDITPAMLVAIIGALVQLLRAFGVYDVTPEQQEALNVATGLLATIVLGDTVNRVARNHADAKRDAAALSSDAEPHDTMLDDIADDELPSDETEFSGPAVVQPSQDPSS